MPAIRTLLAWSASALSLVIVTPFVLVALPFWIVAAGTRALARLFEPAYLTRDQLIQFDPVFGWKARPNLDTHHLMVDLFRISTDAHGWRGESSLEQSDVVVFGDSFAAGYGVGDKHLFANLPRRPRIKPIGIGGYSMVQELLWMRTLAPALQGKLVVWFVYLGNDLYDNLSPELRGYRKPFVREIRGSADWEIVSSHVGPDKWPMPASARHAHIHMTTLAELCADTYLAQRAYRSSEYLIREGMHTTDRVGADLVIFTIPDSLQLTVSGREKLRALTPNPETFDAARPDRELAAICQKLGVRCVIGDTVLDASCYKTNDCHWNEVGHRKIAAMLSGLYERRAGARGHTTPAHAAAARELTGAARSVF